MNDESQENILRGLSASDGIAMGNVFVLSHGDVEVSHYKISESETGEEIKRFESALVQTRQDIIAIKNEISDRVGHGEANIFDAHLMVLEDVALIEETFNILHSELFNVDYCYQKAAQKFIDAFGSIDDSFMRERVSDIKDVSRRVINNLLGKKSSNMYLMSEPKIVMAEDFLPSDFALLDSKNILGLATEKGSLTSHTAIMARSMKIPCVVAVNNLLNSLNQNEFILLDGYTGSIYKNPSEKTLRRYEEVDSTHKQIELLYNTSLPFQNKMLSGESYKLSVNISGAEDLTDEILKNISGVGLFRTENYFINSGSFPSEENQFLAYKEVAEKAGDKPVVIRTLDLGGDKNFANFNVFKKEQNPFMGYRAIRFCLDHEDVFMNQLRAILRASAFGEIKILFPMISLPSELRKAKEFVEKAKEQLIAQGKDFDKNIKVGTMIEVPSAAMTTDILAKMCDFISIGTNDLIQYMYAVDRVNDKVAYLYEPASPAIVRVLNTIATAANEAKCEVSVCGEIAADPIFAPLLLGMGVQELSMSYSSLAQVKFLLRKVEMRELKTLRDTILSIDNARGIMGKLKEFYHSKIHKFLNLPESK